MDKQGQDQDNQIKGNDIVIILCMAIITILLGVLVANAPFGTVR